MATRNGLMIVVVDGLGHGSEAASAARIALDSIGRDPNEPLKTLVRRCHADLRHTRGAVMSLVELNTTERTVTWLSVGNVEAAILRANPSATPAIERVLQRGGVVGYILPPLREMVHRIHPGDTIILATDGIMQGFERSVRLNAEPQENADVICARFARSNDDALVVVALYERNGNV
jgi:negative regulator of sigma-B (phosphoserine phosphatase)